MNHQFHLDELLGKRIAMKTLFFFLANPTTKFSQVELRKRIKLAKATATKWLKEMEKYNLIGVEKIGLTKLYGLNRENPIVKQLKILNNLLSLQGIKNLASKVGVGAYLYGSGARGEDVEDSDIDVVIIGKIRREQIIQDINKISTKLRRKVKIEIFSQMEWSQLAKKDPAFYERVEKDKIEL